jgi:serine/threonine protein kinase
MLSTDTLLQNRYLVIRQIAVGGMGAVYEARDQRLGNIVALKETFFVEESLRKAFHREASILATLRHQALPKVIDHFTEGDGQFLVMEYIRGDDLSNLLQMHGQRGVSPIPQRDALIWADQLLSALEYMHSQRPPVIHRDIKPKNLKLNERGEIILLDFGLAKEEVMDTSRATGSVRGYTLNYAPLEQIQGTGTDPRSDIYSLAATFYHLMTGQAPPDALTRATAHIEGRQDPLRPAHELNPRISPKVSALLEQAMSLDRNRRPASAAAMRAALREAARVDPTAQITVPTQHQRDTEVITRPPANSEDQSTRPVPYTPSPVLDPKFSEVKKKRSSMWIAAAAILSMMAIVGVVAWQRMNRENANTAGAERSVTNPRSETGNIVQLSSREIIESGSNEERYYSFLSEAGELKLTLDVLGAGSIVEVEAIDEKKELMRFDGYKTKLSLSSSGEQEQEISRLIVGREQPVLLRVKTMNPKELQAFRLRIDGPVKMRQAENPGAGKKALAALFTNRDNPLPLVSNTVLAGQDEKKETYYALTAGPGEIKLTLNVIGSGVTVSVEVFNDQAKRLQFRDNSQKFIVSSINLNEEGHAQLMLNRQQRLLMRIHNSYPQSTLAIRLRIDGPVQPAQPDEASSAAGTNDALMRFFTSRDNPEQLRSKEISDRIPEKENYFTFLAGPGRVRVTLEVEGSGPTTSVEFFDSESRQIRFDDNNTRFSVSSIGKKEKKSAQITLAREEKVLMRVSTNYPESVKNFNLKLDGAVKKM